MVYFTLAVAALLPSPTVMLAVYSPASVGAEGSVLPFCAYATAILSIATPFQSLLVTVAAF